MADDDPILFSASPDGIATITLNRPEVHNAFNADVIERLSDLFDDLSNQDDIRAVFIESTGDSYSAGGDLNWMRQAANFTFEENREDAEALGTMLFRLNTLRHPTIALVQGPAYGGGVGLVASCDIAVAVKSARFALSEVTLGLLPATISPYVVAAMGMKQARRYFLTAERFDAEEARRIGLVNEVVEDAAGLAAMRDHFTKALLQCAPGAVADSKALVFDVANRPVDKGLVSMTAKRIAERRATEEGQEGVDAFLNKRKPDWIQ